MAYIVWRVTHLQHIESNTIYTWRQAIAIHVRMWKSLICRLYATLILLLHQKFSNGGFAIAGMTVCGLFAGFGFQPHGLGLRVFGKDIVVEIIWNW